VSGPTFDPTDPLFKPLTLKQVLEITGRTRRTIERWSKDGRIARYELTHMRKIVTVFNEDEITAVEKERNDAAMENLDRIRRSGGRRESHEPPEVPET